jgi:carbonic anhydrase
LYSAEKKFDDPLYFKKLSLGQHPQYLWIGCSDSRVPPNELTKTQSGEIFVHRNIANMVVHTDLNMLSVVEYAVEVLGVKHIIVCGHYGCGGIRAAMTSTPHGYVDKWLRNIKEVYARHEKELELIADEDDRADRLVELNIVEQVRNLAKTKIVQRAWKNGELEVHGWVYGINSGLIKELNTVTAENPDIDPIFQYKFE